MSSTVMGVPHGQELLASTVVDGDRVVLEVCASVSGEDGTFVMAKVVSSEGAAAASMRFRSGSIVWVPLLELDLGEEP